MCQKERKVVKVEGGEGGQMKEGEGRGGGGGGGCGKQEVEQNLEGKLSCPADQSRWGL